MTERSMAHAIHQTQSTRPACKVDGFTEQLSSIGIPVPVVAHII